jgi:glycosyltransferase involved in cell wall biosynthesis
MMSDEGVDVRGCGGRGGWDIRVLPRLARIMRETEPDIVHALLFHANLAARLTAWEVGISPDRVVCEIQTVEVERRWHLTVDRWTHRGCRFTIGNSPSVIDHLASRAGIPRDRLRLVRGGIDPGPIRRATPIGRSMLDLPADAPIVLWAGRLDPIKGLTILIDSFRTIAADYGAHLLLAGTGPLQDQLAAQVGRMGLSEHVHLLGARRDVPPLLKAADVFALPSRTEGLPNALLEAMAAGCAIVTTNVPGCRDLIQHEETGLVVPYGDTAALGSAVQRLLDDRPLARRLGRAAAAAVGRDWHIDKTYAAYHAIYEETMTIT